MMANAAYKHEVGHAGKKFACKYWNKAFQFKGALKALKHQGKTYSCEKCPKKTSSPYNMKQHVQGAHEGGFPCPRGTKEKWPRDVQKHNKPVLHVKILQKGT